MKRLSFFAILTILLASALTAQELAVYQYSESFGRFNLTLNNGIPYSALGQGNEYYFTFSYVGEDYQAYRSITLIIDRREHFLLFTHIEQNWTGVATETCHTDTLDNTVLTALRRANNVGCKVYSVRFDRDITFPLSNDSLARLKSFIR
jgi:hypothetical protein